MNRSAKERWILAAIAITLLVMFFLLLFSVSTMPDGSMQRMGVIPKNDEVKKGDVILALRWFRRDSIKTGDLLVVKVFTNSTLLHVVRRVAKIE